MNTENQTPSKNTRILVYFPILLSLILVIGVLIGYYFSFNYKSSKNNFKAEDKGKIEKVLNFIEQHYVDKIKTDSLSDLTLSALLNSLDPHSEYIPASQLESVNEPLEGNFSGIGVEFNILNDTITIINPINGGPSEKIGIKAGDKIIFVDNENVAGIKISNQQVFKKLRGEKGTKVHVKIKRNSTKQLVDFYITRGEIPIYSIETSFMVTPSIGYIKINRFAATTYTEYLTAFNQLKKEGMKKLILDLRGNGGGYLNAAVDIADEFLQKGMRIVYTQGAASPRKDYKASDKGGFENDPIVLLIDEGSASASEILAGAIQDNDRGTLIGRRTFGKGLVQEQLEMPDGSALRLTTARYYTPTGRCIQKPYDKGNDAYFEEEFHRFENGELLNNDSIKFVDSLKYKTPSGKIVYGGGGIVPDIFVSIDTSYRSSWLNKIIYKGLFNDFALEFVNANRLLFENNTTSQLFKNNYTVDNKTLTDFLNYCVKNKIPIDNISYKKAEKFIKIQLKALIGRIAYTNSMYYQVNQQQDLMLKKAIEVLH